MPYSFGKEETPEKSVTVIDTSDMSREIISLKPLHVRATLTGTYDELLRADYPEEIIRGYTKLNVTDVHLGLESISYLRERYDHPLEISGRLYESDDTVSTLSLDELEEKSHDPADIFRQFYLDTVREEPDAHLTGLFNEALARYEERTSEQ